MEAIQTEQANEQTARAATLPATSSNVTDATETPPEPSTDSLADALVGLEVQLKNQMGEPLPEAAEAQTEATTEETQSTPEGDEGESPESKPEVDYGAIPQAPVMGKDQEPMTIGQMKDEITERRTRSAKVEKLEFELMQQRDVVNQILANDGPLSDAQKQQAAQMAQAMSERQTQTVMDMFPEWQDPAIRNKVVPQLTTVAKSAGFSDAEIGQLTHPALFNLLERVRRYEEREALGIQALKAAKKPKPERGRSPQPPSSKAVKYQQVADRITGGNDQPADWYQLGKILGVD